MNETTSAYRYQLTLLILVGFFIRLIFIFIHPIDALEGHSLSWSFHFFSKFRAILVDYHLPLDFLLRSILSEIFYQNIFVQRLYTLLISTASIYALFHLTSLIKDRRTGLLAALLISFSPYHIMYCTHARMYALLTLLIIITLYLYLKSRLDHTRRYRILFLYLGSSLCLTHYYGVFFYLAIYLHYLIDNRIKLNKNSLLYLIPLFIALPFASYALSLGWHNNFHQAAWFPPIDRHFAHNTFYTFFLSNYGKTSQYLPYLLLSYALCLLPLFMHPQRKIITLYSVSLITAIIAVLLSIFLHPLLSDNKLTIWTPLAFTCMAISLTEIKSIYRHIALFFLLAFSFAKILNLILTPMNIEIQDAAKYISHQPSIPIVVPVTKNYWHWFLYLPPLHHKIHLPFPISALATKKIHEKIIKHPQLFFPWPKQPRAPEHIVTKLMNYHLPQSVLQNNFFKTTCRRLYNLLKQYIFTITTPIIDSDHTYYRNHLQSFYNIDATYEFKDLYIFLFKRKEKH